MIGRLMGRVCETAQRFKSGLDNRIGGGSGLDSRSSGLGGIDSRIAGLESRGVGLAALSAASGLGLDRGNSTGSGGNTGVSGGSGAGNNSLDNRNRSANAPYIPQPYSSTYSSQSRYN